MSKTSSTYFGLGLRTAHYQAILSTQPGVDWFEIITEDYLVAGGNPLYYLDKIAELYPIAMHGVSLSLGSHDPIDYNYLQQIKTLAKRVSAIRISDHLCWTGTQGTNLHDLLPLPYNEETLNYLVTRINQVQDYLGQQILLENISNYINYKSSTISEWEFLTELVKRADCYLLLDVNNIYVNAFNHGFDPLVYLKHLPAERIKQLHLAGHQHLGTHLIDTHDCAISQSVWDLYQATIKEFGLLPVSIERDANIPALNEVLIELNYAKSLSENYSK